MKDTLSNQKSLMIVRKHDAVDLLMNMQAARHLAPFMHAEQTLGSAAAEIGRRPSSVAYWVRRLLQAGLLVVVREQARAGKPIPYYKAAAAEFRVPFDAMPSGAREEFLHGARKLMVGEFAASVERAARTFYSDGLSITGHKTHGVSISFIEPKDDASPIMEWWGKVSLTKAEAAEFRSELEALVSRFDGKPQSPTRSRYLVMVGITPTTR